MQIPNNSNIALLVHLINRAEDSEAMEFWIMSAIIEYTNACMEIELDDLDEEDKIMGQNMQNMAFEVIKAIQMKHPKDKNLH